MLYSKPAVYWVYVEDKSNGCVAHFLQLLNFNQFTFQKNSVSFLPTQQVVINLAILHDYVQTECSNLFSSNHDGRLSIWLESKTS